MFLEVVLCNVRVGVLGDCFADVTLWVMVAVVWIWFIVDLIVVCNFVVVFLLFVASLVGGFVCCADLT